MTTLADKLLTLKETIEDAKTKSATLEGQLISLHARLKELGCSSVEDAEKKIKELQKKADKFELEIEKGIKDFEAKYEF